MTTALGCLHVQQVPETMQIKLCMAGALSEVYHQPRHQQQPFWFQIASWLVGNSLPRNKAVQLLWQRLQAQNTSTCHTEASLSNCVIDLATRKSYGVKGGQSLNVASHTLPLQCVALLVILRACDLTTGKREQL